MKCPRCGMVFDPSYSACCPSCHLEVVPEPTAPRGSGWVQDRGPAPKTLRIEGSAAPSPTDSARSIAASLMSTYPGRGAISALRVFAWLDLLAGIILGIIVWVEFGKSGYGDPNPVGIAAGLALVLQGVFGCAFLLVVASIAENIAALRRKLESQPEQRVAS